jgi:hypothetical protein
MPRHNPDRSAGAGGDARYLPFQGGTLAIKQAIG